MTPQPYYQANGITIYHGDCREIAPQLDLPRDTLVLTDPPYGDNHDTDYVKQFKFKKGRFNHPRRTHLPIAGDDEAFDPAWLLAIGAAQIIFGYNRFANKLPVGAVLVWDKRLLSQPIGGVLSDGEVAWHSQGKGVYIFSHMWKGFSRASEKEGGRGGKHLHPTQKPVILMQWCIQRAPKTGLVFDPYMGSGPVARAALNLGRPYIGIEIEEQYIKETIERLHQLPLLTV